MEKNKILFRLLKLSTSAILTLVAILTFIIVHAEAFDKPYKQTFITTAYYSPLPNQKYYIRGDVWADKKLNGNGTHGADGTPVFIGMLAAPKNIPFGTIIDMQDMGVGIVHDRGGAIVATGVRGNSKPRLDIWMGYGDEGLLRALAWGVREIKTTVLPPGSREVTSYVKLPVPGALTYFRAETFYRAGKSTTTAAKQEFPEHIEKLTLLGFQNTSKDILAFQVQHNIVSGEQEKGAGNLGPATRSKIDEIFKLADIETPREGLSKEDLGDEVRKLQKLLTQTGYLKHEITGYFGEQTEKALMDFQVYQGILEETTNRSAGFLGPETRKKLKLFVLEKYQKKDTLLTEKNDLLPKLEIVFTALSTNQKSEESTLTESYEFERTLTLGSKGKEVKDLQSFLKNLGFFNEEPNGVYGPITKIAVENFQNAHGIETGKAGGIFGPQTRFIANQYRNQPMITSYIQEI